MELQEPHYFVSPALAPAVEDVQASAWRIGLPALVGRHVTLRELRESDAASLCSALNAGDVSRFIAPPPCTIEGFERFIEAMQRQREAGMYLGYAVTLAGSDVAMGLVHVRSFDPDFGTAEWGFAIASELWGTGVFSEAAHLLLNYVFGVIGSRRLEARAATGNGRGNGALQKIGAVPEGVLRNSLVTHGEEHDEVLWTILADEWLGAKAVNASQLIH
jgi:RimJ/RimL family protein N-acetyltransferase